MHKALNETLASLPDDTKVYVGSLTLTSPFLILTLYLQQPGHEYTKGNVRFAKRVLENDAIKKLEEFAQNNKETQGKFTIGDEKVSSLQQICNLASKLILAATQCIHESKRVYMLITRAYPMNTQLTALQDPSIQKLVGYDKPVDVMRTLREMKDRAQRY